MDFGFRLKRFNSKKLKKLIKTSLLFTYFSAHAWNRYRTCVKTFPHMRENFSAHAWKLFRTCVKNFRTCVKTFPHAWNRFRTCVKTFPDLRENFFAHASQLFLTCVNTFPHMRENFSVLRDLHLRNNLHIPTLNLICSFGTKL